MTESSAKSYFLQQQITFELAFKFIFEKGVSRAFQAETAQFKEELKNHMVAFMAEILQEQKSLLTKVLEKLKKLTE